jgi:ribonuclease HI
MILFFYDSSITAMESRKISLHTHLFVSFMWVPAHVGIAGNERADFEVRQATLENMVYNAQSVPRDLLPIAKQRMLEWQKSWEVTETGRF